MSVGTVVRIAPDDAGVVPDPAGVPEAGVVAAGEAGYCTSGYGKSTTEKHYHNNHDSALHTRKCEPVLYHACVRCSSLFS